MSQYPVILIPDTIQKVQSALPLVPAPPKAPQQPGAAPKKVNNTVIAVEAAVALPVIPVVSTVTSLPSWLLFFMAVGAIAGHVTPLRYSSCFHGFCRDSISFKLNTFISFKIISRKRYRRI